MAFRYTAAMSLLDDIKFNADGLIPAIAQDAESRQVLMLAWMNEAAIRETLNTGRAVYYSRSRQRLWRKGESSGNEQLIRDIRLDCDGDTLLLMVDQRGGVACHTGRASCFYLQPSDDHEGHGDNDSDGDSNGRQWRSVEPVLKSPEDMYGK